MKTTIDLDEMKNIRGGNSNNTIILLGTLIMLAPALGIVLTIVKISISVS
ncbi:hypothetical protein THERMOT_149 [Bathymodiolus thermophilus thioautotrophic gill symbiont]|uniref:Uncharacterized protein n=1 Tax=Bathymodiolus thermophilus thioautotrophic gill symbiont TaxID=2360 RepID=A0A8H9CH38_9GAMM|nr:hypothetical protein [Bathymodiolus thermophilus thioautotrophic gill symbiont]CAB5494663.1 hypothetical protein THERMOT_149 [Bathymodiolus thermophilus thioautotrophic gill symbiont]CAB5502034.1 hypothetical protein THERMOS_1510 [Bathymodiolus thermophilus thioautotrophic gill symbiont]